MLLMTTGEPQATGLDDRERRRDAHRALDAPRGNETEYHDQADDQKRVREVHQHLKVAGKSARQCRRRNHAGGSNQQANGHRQPVQIEGLVNIHGLAGTDRKPRRELTVGEGGQSRDYGCHNERHGCAHARGTNDLADEHINARAENVAEAVKRNEGETEAATQASVSPGRAFLPIHYPSGNRSRYASASSW